MKIQVKREHIDGGACAVPNKCMIAAAIKELEPDVAYVSVRTNGITVTHRAPGRPAIREHYAVPLKAARAIVKFDLGEPVDPFTFTAKLVDRTVLPILTAKQTAKNKVYRREHRAKQTEPRPHYGRQTRVAGV